MQIKKIIIINGSGGVGKDTFVELIKNECEKSGSTGVINISTVDTIKEVAKRLGWDGKKDEKSRKFLSDLKDLWTGYNDGPFNDILTKIDFNTRFEFVIFFVHSREPEEIQRFKDYYKDNCITLLIKRPNYSISTNRSDRDVELFNYDIIIDNDGDLYEFEKKASIFAESYLKRIT